MNGETLRGSQSMKHRLRWNSVMHRLPTSLLSAIMLVKETMLVDGKARDLRDVMRDANLHALISDEGPIARLRY